MVYMLSRERGFQPFSRESTKYRFSLMTARNIRKSGGESVYYMNRCRSSFGIDRRSPTGHNSSYCIFPTRNLGLKQATFIEVASGWQKSHAASGKQSQWSSPTPSAQNSSC